MWSPSNLIQQQVDQHALITQISKAILNPASNLLPQSSTTILSNKAKTKKETALTGDKRGTTLLPLYSLGNVTIHLNHFQIEFHLISL